MPAATDIALLMAADDNFAMPLAVAAFSALVHLPANCTVNIYVIDGGITAESQTRVTRVINDAHRHVDVHFCKVDLSALSHCDVGRYSLMTLARLFVGQVIPPDVERVLYLDCDITVTDDLSVLWHIDMCDHPVMAVKEAHRANKKTLFHNGIEGHHFNPDAPYFNAGVMLLQMALWRAKNLEERTVATLLKHGDAFALPDQDALNVTLHGLWGELNPRWNMQVWELKSATAHPPGLTHFSVRKPWQPNYPYRAGEQFIAAYLRSGWDPKHQAIPKAALMIARNATARFWRRLKRGTRRIWRHTGGRLIRVKPRV